MYTVKQLADLAGVSVRTLHYYDEIDLLKPTQVRSSGYRYYDDAALLRLQQILLYREMDLELLRIRDMLDAPDFDTAAALRAHRQALEAKVNRLRTLIHTVDNTLLHLIEEVDMTGKQMFEGFSPEQEKQYEREARLQYGPQLVNESVKRWNSYSEAEKARIRDEGNQIYADMVRAIHAQLPASSTAVQAIVRRWHEHIRYFYEPTLDVLRGLGDLYLHNPDFNVKFNALHPDLATFMQQAIFQYVDALETAELERMLAEDQAQRRLRA